MTLNQIFQLKVITINGVCHFELSWGVGKTIPAQLDYPTSLTASYTDWQQAYLNYYENLKLRGEVLKRGKIKAPPQDWAKSLGEAEHRFLLDFHRWLRNEQLYEIHKAIVDATGDVPNSGSHWVDIFLTCNTPELARLPWEAWEINTKLSSPGTRNIRVARVPNKIRNSTVSPIRRKARVLAILGDEKGLDFQEDKQALRSFSKVAEIEFIGWQPKKDITQLKEEIVEKISDRRGWDILFFAGHSNETAYTGGELRIAPNVSITINDIAQPLQQARDRGLQFAIFNSCSGISIAESLINLGLPQVAVMREPIHNQVAQEFLVQFLNSLSEYKDVHEALLDACAFLKEKKNLTYPSTYLIPSLFRHPQSELFRLEPVKKKRIFKHFLPTKREVFLISTVLILSLLPPVQDRFLDIRLWIQTVYRQITHQYPYQSKTPVLLVEIDENSRRESLNELKDIRPINYRYLARIVDKLSTLETKVIGIDYLLDNRQQSDNSRELSKSIRNAVQKGTWFIFAADEYSTPTSGVSNEIANLNWSMQGDIHSLNSHIELLPANAECYQACPFTYLLALTHTLHFGKFDNLPKPQLTNKTDLRNQLVEYLNGKNINNSKAAYLHKLRLHPISNSSQWFHPIIDFSLPPKTIYESISASDLLKGENPPNIEKQVVLIIPGGYAEAGVDKEGEDNLPTPLAIGLWGQWSEGFTGGKLNAYMVHHLLTQQRLVVPIPDFFTVLLAVVLGKLTTLLIKNNNHRQQSWFLGIVIAVYIFVSLQIYISFMVLVPIVLPLGVFGIMCAWRWEEVSSIRQSKIL
jgi:CHASE2 domain-containing sensor protein